MISMFVYLQSIGPLTFVDMLSNQKKCISKIGQGRLFASYLLVIFIRSHSCINKCTFVMEED